MSVDAAALLRVRAMRALSSGGGEPADDDGCMRKAARSVRCAKMKRSQIGPQNCALVGEIISLDFGFAGFAAARAQRLPFEMDLRDSSPH